MQIEIKIQCLALANLSLFFAYPVRGETDSEVPTGQAESVVLLPGRCSLLKHGRSRRDQHWRLLSLAVSSAPPRALPPSTAPSEARGAPRSHSAFVPQSGKYAKCDHGTIRPHPTPLLYSPHQGAITAQAQTTWL